MSMKSIRCFSISRTIWNPQKGGRQGLCAVARGVLGRSEKVGIAKVIIKTRQYLAVVKAEDRRARFRLMHSPRNLPTTGKCMCRRNSSPEKKEIDIGQGAHRIA